MSSVANDCLNLINEFIIHTEAYTMETPQLEEALHALEGEFSANFIDHKLVGEATGKGQVRFSERNRIHNDTVRPGAPLYEKLLNIISRK